MDNGIVANNNILAIDEGNEYSGYCILDSKTYEPLKFGKIDNNELLGMIPELKETWNISESLRKSSLFGWRSPFSHREIVF